MNTQPTPTNGIPLPIIAETDMQHICLIAVYLVQKNQQRTLAELKELAFTQLGCTLEEEALERALDAAKKRNFVAINRRTVKGQSRKVYSLKNLGWSSPPEVAHVSDLLPRLVEGADPSLRNLKDFFDKEESDKGPQTKKARGNDIDDYVSYKVTALTLDPLLGSQIKSPHSESVRERFPSPADSLDVEGMFARDELTGEYLIPPDVLSGWFATNCARYTGMADARAAYIAFLPVRIKPKVPVQQFVLPVTPSKGRPSAPKPYEAIAAGQEIEFRFSAPTKGFLTPEQIERLFVFAGLRPRRGISPARGRRFGRFMVTSFTIEGRVKDDPISYLTGDVPDSVLHEHGAYLLAAVARLGHVSLCSKGAVAQETESSDDEE